MVHSKDGGLPYCLICIYVVYLYSIEWYLYCPCESFWRQNLSAYHHRMVYISIMAFFITPTSTFWILKLMTSKLITQISDSKISPPTGRTINLLGEVFSPLGPLFLGCGGGECFFFATWIRNSKNGHPKQRYPQNSPNLTVRFDWFLHSFQHTGIVDIFVASISAFHLRILLQSKVSSSNPQLWQSTKSW